MIYFGDHLFSDLRGPSKAGWRTAAIIHELEVRSRQDSFQLFIQLLSQPYFMNFNEELVDFYLLLFCWKQVGNMDDKFTAKFVIFCNSTQNQKIQVTTSIFTVLNCLRW